MGLILVPLVEKVAEHLTAVDEAWDNQMNFALAHVLGATIQTALFNSSLVVIVGWGLGKGMDLNFETFNIVVLILAIIVVGNFLRDQKSNYLEGALCILIYIIIGKTLVSMIDMRLIRRQPLQPGIIRILPMERQAPPGLIDRGHHISCVAALSRVQ